jgi:hypothetical protein
MAQKALSHNFEEEADRSQKLFEPNQDGRIRARHAHLQAGPRRRWRNRQNDVRQTSPDRRVREEVRRHPRCRSSSHRLPHHPRPDPVTS